MFLALYFNNWHCYLQAVNYTGQFQTCRSVCIILNKFKGKRQSWNPDSKMTKDKFSPPPGFDPRYPEPESYSATKELHWPHWYKSFHYKKFTNSFSIWRFVRNNDSKTRVLVKSFVKLVMQMLSKKCIFRKLT